MSKARDIIHHPINLTKFSGVLMRMLNEDEIVAISGGLYGELFLGFAVLAAGLVGYYVFTNQSNSRPLNDNDLAYLISGHCA